MIISVAGKVYQMNIQSVVCMIKPNHSSLGIVYADNTKFDNLRLQKWLRETIREEIIPRVNNEVPFKAKNILLLGKSRLSMVTTGFYKNSLYSSEISIPSFL